jgi:hypothetical protein
MKLRDQPKNLLFPLLPEELCLIILSFLERENDLGRILLTNRDGRRFAIIEHERRLINAYKEALIESPLWRYLALIDQAENEDINGQRFLDYLEIVMGTIPPNQRANLNTFSRFKQNALLSPWLQQLPTNFSEKFPKARMMAGRIMLCYQPEKDPDDARKTSNPQTLTKFMKSVDGNFSELAFWESYSDLYTITLCFALAIKLSWTTNEIEKLFVISDPIFGNFVNGKTLCVLDNLLAGSIQHGLIMRMLQEAIRLYQMPNKQPTDILKLEILEHALGRLVEDDWVEYFAKCFDKDNLWWKRNSFAHIILRHNYPFLQERLTEKVLLTLTEPYDKELCYFDAENFSQVVLIILINTELRKQLSQKGLVTLLKRLPFDNIPPALSDPGLAPFLTVTTLRQWLDESNEVSFITHEQDEDYFSERAACILTNANLLNNLQTNEITFFAKYVRGRIDYITKNANFISRVIHDSQPNKLLMALCKLEPCTFAIGIAGSKDLVNLLTPPEIVRLGTLCAQSRLHIVKNAQAIAKLSSDQFWKLIELANAESAELVCKNNFLAKLNDEQLRKFEYEWKDSTEIVEAIRNERIRQYDSRIKRNAVSNVVAPKTKESDQTEGCQLKQPATLPQPISPVVVNDKQVKSNVYVGRSATQLKPAVNKPRLVLTKVNRHHLKFVAPIIIFSLLTLLGIGLITTGVGCSIGIPLCVKAAALLVSWAPIAPVIPLVATGVFIAGIAFIQDIKKILQYKRELSIPSTIFISTFSKPLPLKPLAPLIASSSKQMNPSTQALPSQVKAASFSHATKSLPTSSKFSSPRVTRARSESAPSKFEYKHRA